MSDIKKQVGDGERAGAMLDQVGDQVGDRGHRCVTSALIQSPIFPTFVMHIMAIPNLYSPSPTLIADVYCA